VLVRRSPVGGWTGERVELNAMTSNEFIAWLEGKLAAVGVKKMIPDRETLEKAYRRAVRQARVQQVIDAAIANLEQQEEQPVPEDLADRILNKLKGSARAWDDVLWDLVTDEDLGDEEHEADEDELDAE
jgi:hypothetical protein